MKLVHSFQIFPKTNHTSADSRNCFPQAKYKLLCSKLTQGI